MTELDRVTTAAGGVHDNEAKGEFTTEQLALGRRIYDENTQYIYIAPGMSNQIYRNGFLPKKTLDGDGYTRAQASKNYYRENVPSNPRPNTPNGSIIIHKDEIDPRPGNCNTFIHPSYGSEIEYRGEKGMDYAADLTLMQLSKGSSTCGFCSILYRGIQSQREFWILQWARCRWLDTHTFEEQEAIGSSMPWVHAFADEVIHGKEVDENEIFLYVSFPRGHSHVGVHMMVNSHPTSNTKRRRSLVDVEFYTTPELPSKWAAFGPAPHIFSEVIADDSLERLTSWIDDCKSNHPECTRKSKSGMPSRLLHIGDLDDDDLPVIQLEDTDAQRQYEYVALSHVWSLTSPMKTTLENLARHREAITWDELSIALRETIILTLSLGITYLWIDSLCIIQDSPDDWEAEYPRMGLTYNSAAVVFAVHGPQLGFQKAPLVELRDLTSSGAESDNPVYARLKIDHTNMFSAPNNTESWFGRGWCMQERHFAPRILHFGGYCEEVTFECNTLTNCECSRISGARLGDHVQTLKFRLNHAFAAVEKQSNSTEDLDQLWKVYILACEDYTARGLTYGSDTLPAISSLMSQFSPYLGTYYAGIWERYLILSLQWESLDTQHCHRHKEYVAPSWSWASRSGAAIWYLEYTSLETPVPTSVTHDFATVVNISSAIVEANPLGKVSNGKMTLRGYVTKMDVSSTQPLIPDGRMTMRKQSMDGQCGECYVTFDTIEDALGAQEGETLTCLDIVRDKKGIHGNFVSALVLRKVDEEGGNYRRVGFSTMKAEHFVGCDVMEITTI